MNNYINYVIEANMGLVLFLTFYTLMLRQETNFSFKRSYLLVSIATALLFPILKIVSQRFFPVSNLPSLQVLPEIVFSDGQDNHPVGSFSLDAIRMIIWVYVSGVILLSIRLLIQLLRLNHYSKKQHSYLASGKYRVVEVGDTAATFSFFNTIFIGNLEGLSTEDKRLIISHEIIHAEKLHSLDILLLEIIHIIFWFNPLLSFYKKIFVSLHEFQADEAVLERHDMNQYCNLLARVALMSADVRIANHFNNPLISKRITMMKTIKKKISMWKISMAVPLIAGFAFFVACQDRTTNDATRTDNNPSAGHPIQGDSKIYTMVDESASPVGGIESLSAFIGSNLRYPEETRKAGKEGKVFIQFVVNADGSLSDFSVKKGADAKMDEEALRVARLLKPWNPGKQNGIAVRQQFILPISFKLNG